MVVVYMSNPNDFVISGGILILVVVYMGNPNDFVLSGSIQIWLWSTWVTPMILSYQGVF